jgi:hypothetical protein
LPSGCFLPERHSRNRASDGNSTIPSDHHSDPIT